MELQNLSNIFAIYNFTAYRLNFFQKKIIKQDLISAEGVNLGKGKTCPQAPSYALAGPQSLKSQNHAHSSGCKTPWGSTYYTPSFRPLLSLIKLRVPFTFKGKTHPQLFGYADLRTPFTLEGKTRPHTKKPLLYKPVSFLTWPQTLTWPLFGVKS